MKEMGVLLLALLLVLFIPIAVIDSVNVLFPSAMIDLSFKTWLSTFVLVLIFAPKGR